VPEVPQTARARALQCPGRKERPWPARRADTLGQPGHPGAVGSIAVSAFAAMVHLPIFRPAMSMARLFDWPDHCHCHNRDLIRRRRACRPPLRCGSRARVLELLYVEVASSQASKSIANLSDGHAPHPAREFARANCCPCCTSGERRRAACFLTWAREENEGWGGRCPAGTVPGPQRGSAGALDGRTRLTGSCLI